MFQRVENSGGQLDEAEYERTENSNSRSPSLGTLLWTLPTPLATQQCLHRELIRCGEDTCNVGYADQQDLALSPWRLDFDPIGEICISLL